MTIKTLDEIIEIMQKYNRGSVLQINVNNKGVWYDVFNGAVIKFDWINNDYRIKDEWKQVCYEKQLLIKL